MDVNAHDKKGELTVIALKSRINLIQAGTLTLMFLFDQLKRRGLQDLQTKFAFGTYKRTCAAAE